MLSVAGADHIITMDLHASQIQVSGSEIVERGLGRRELIMLETTEKQKPAQVPLRLTSTLTPLQARSLSAYFLTLVSGVDG